MKHLLQIIFFLFTCFSSSATPLYAKEVVPTYQATTSLLSLSQSGSKAAKAIIAQRMQRLKELLKDPKVAEKVTQNPENFAESLDQILDPTNDYQQHLKTPELYVKQLVQGAGKLFTTAELKLLKRADLPDFVRNNIDDLLSEGNRKAIWDLTDYCATCQFQRGDLIEEIFNHWGSKYKNYQNLNEVIPNYKTLDFDGVLNNVSEVVSLKTYQPKLTTEKTLSGITSKIDNYANKLSTATLDAAHSSKNRVLDFVIKKGEWDGMMDDILDHAEEAGKLKNITIRITEF